MLWSLDQCWSIVYTWSCLLTRTLELCLVKLVSTSASRQPPSFTVIHLKNLQKNRTAPLRPITLRRPSQRLNHQLLRVKLKNSKGTVQCSLPVYSRLASVKKTIWTCVPQKFVGNSYIPGYFLSPGSYTSGHVARIQLYTCHHLEHPSLGRYFRLFFG